MTNTLDPEPAPPADAVDLQSWMLWDDERLGRLFGSAQCSHAGFRAYLGGVQFWDGTVDSWIYVADNNSDHTFTTAADAHRYADELRQLADAVDREATGLPLQ